MSPLALLLFLAVLQGLTEYLPVSSSGHLVLARELLPGGERLPEDASIEVLLHVGTLLSVLVFYRREVGALILGGLGLAGPEETRLQRRRILLLAAATLPLLPLVPVEGWIEETFYTGTVLAGIALLVTGSFLFWSRRFPAAGAGLEALSLRIALLMGVAQAMAVVPGISRSGATIVTGLALGLSVEAAAAFSFLMSVPAILGASVLKLPDVLAGSPDQPPALDLLLAGAASFATGLAALGLLLWIARNRRLSWFAPYCWAAGLLVLWLGHS